jgi:hypothetical protein
MSKLMCAVSPLLLLVVNLGLIPSSLGGLSPRRYDSIFSFDNSFTDTGNNPSVFAENDVFNHVTRPPYGSTFFGRPTGRSSDGRLIMDFVGNILYNLLNYHFRDQTPVICDCRTTNVMCSVNCSARSSAPGSAARAAIPGA